MSHPDELEGHPEVVRALFVSSSRGDLVDAVAMVKLIREHRSRDWPVVKRSEIEGWLKVAQKWVEAPEPPTGWPLNWRWAMGRVQGTLHQALRARRTLGILCITGCIRASLDGHEHHLAALGYDPYEDERVGMLYLLARLTAETKPQPWERRILNHRHSTVRQVARYTRIRHQRQARRLSQGQLAEAVGVSRSTVMRWEAGESRPQPAYREALARVLGGRPEDYE